MISFVKPHPYTITLSRGYRFVQTTTWVHPSAFYNPDVAVVDVMSPDHAGATPGYLDVRGGCFLSSIPSTTCAQVHSCQWQAPNWRPVQARSQRWFWHVHACNFKSQRRVHRITLDTTSNNCVFRYK